MEIIYVDDLYSFSFDKDKLCTAVGNFDGVHLGHQKLISECMKTSCKSAVLTFSPHPSIFIKRIPNYHVLTPLAKKARIIEKMGIDYLIVVNFNLETSKIDKQVFIDFLKRINVRQIVCGYDFTFGYRALGTTSDLSFNIKTNIVPKFIKDGLRVSTTHIKELITEGEVDIAKTFLNRYYSIEGEVVHGNKLGRVLGFKTANVDYTQYLLPKTGVYLSRIKVDDIFYYGMCNIGNNPTVNYSEDKKMEINIFDFEEEIYGKNICVEFIKRLRPERKFSSKEDLISQLTTDQLECKKLAKTLEV